MHNFFVQFFFSWPAIIGSLLVSSLGICLRRPGLCVAGALYSAGFALYLIALPALIFKLAGFSIPLLHLAVMVLVRRGRRIIAGLLLLPHAVIAIYLLFLLVSGPTPRF